MSKVCFKCGESQSLSAFYKHKAMADGHLNKCKECTKSDVKRHRAENDSVRAYDRARAKLPDRAAHRAIVTRKYREEHPERYAAHNAVSNALRDGRLEKRPCEICGDEDVHGHHDDYSKPLAVRWLCPLHHARHHAGEMA